MAASDLGVLLVDVAIAVAPHGDLLLQNPAP
jgi:hypothetical protein